MIGSNNNLNPLNNRSSSFRSQPYALSRGSYIQSPSHRDRSRSISPVNNKKTYASNIHPSLLSSELKNIPEDINMYPTGFGDLLKHQNRYIKAFKLQINKQKERVDDDMQSFKIELNHTLEDLRLSLHAHLDRVYQIYLDKVAKFKSELFDINRLKQQLQMELGATSLSQVQSKLSRDRNVPQRDIDQNFSSPFLSFPNISKVNNTILQQKIQTISNMQTGNKQLKKYYILNHIAQIQKQKMFPLTQLQKQLVVLNTHENGFYQSKEFLKILTNLRDVMSRQVKNVYDNNYIYIRDIDGIGRKEDANGTRVLDALNNSYYGQVPNVPPPIIKTYTHHQPPNISHLNSINFNKSVGSPLQGVISSSFQSLRTNSTQQANLTTQNLNFKLPDNLLSQTALCGIYINNQIALGLKDGFIQILSCDGFNIATLKQHKANICSLAVVRSGTQNYLVSGSDAGCSLVVVWDPVTWQPRHIFNTHTAAITGIIDLQDGVHFMSAGYDKKINVYSLEQGKHVYEAPQSESPITGLVINNNGSRVISSCLNKTLFVFRVVRDGRSRVDNIIQQRKIQNNAIICSMISSQILPQLLVIATKDAKIKLVNIEKGQSYKTVPFTNHTDQSGLTYPLEMMLIERDTKQYYPIALVWPSKQHKIYQVNTESTLVSVKNLGMDSGTLQYGYGVNPKSFYVPDNRGALIYTVNQQSRAANRNCATILRLEDIR